MSLPVFSTVRRVPRWIPHTNAPFGDLSIWHGMTFMFKTPIQTPTPLLHHQIQKDGTAFSPFMTMKDTRRKCIFSTLSSYMLSSYIDCPLITVLIEQSMGHVTIYCVCACECAWVCVWVCVYYMIMYVYTVSFDYIYFSMFTFIFKSSIFVFSSHTKIPQLLDF